MELDPSALPLLLGGQIWAIRPDALPHIMELARSRHPQPPAQAAMVTQPASSDGPGIAVIPLCGVLTPQGSFLSYLFGGGLDGVQGFRDQLARAVADPSVNAIVLDVDSPGGSVGLVPEAAADVRAARDVKPVYAVANTQAASGAYWIASQATELFCTPSGMVGSIGVYYVHEDWSGFNEKTGINVTYVAAGKYKTEGNMDEPLSQAGQEAWQADADTLYSMFVGDVAAGRGTTASAVSSGYGEGRCLLATDAKTAGMIDGVETLQTIVRRALTEAVTTSGPSARRLGRATIMRPPARADAMPPAPDDEPEPEDDPEDERDLDPIAPDDELEPAPDDSDPDDDGEDDPDEDDGPNATSESARQAFARLLFGA